MSDRLTVKKRINEVTNVVETHVVAIQGERLGSYDENADEDKDRRDVLVMAGHDY